MEKSIKNDVKQIKLIEKKINLFEKGKINLSILVSDLQGILNFLENIDDSWISGFQSELNFLEIMYDSIEDGSISKWNGDFKKELSESIIKLKKQTSFILKKYCKYSDLTVLETAFEGNFNWVICPICSDTWIENSTDAMIICPKCDSILHNPYKG